MTSYTTTAEAKLDIVGGSHTKTTFSSNDKGYIYTVDVPADGKVAADDDGLVNGKTVYDETRPAEKGTYIDTGNSAGTNLFNLDKGLSDEVTERKKAIDVSPDGDTTIKKDITVNGNSETKRKFRC